MPQISASPRSKFLMYGLIALHIHNKLQEIEPKTMQMPTLQPQNWLLQFYANVLLTEISMIIYA